MEEGWGAPHITSALQMDEPQHPTLGRCGFFKSGELVMDMRLIAVRGLRAGQIGKLVSDSRYIDLFVAIVVQTQT